VKTVDSQALGLVNRALGLTGAGAPLTEFLDGQVDQTLDIAALVRRGRTQAGTGGIYIGVMENVHGAADSQQSQIVPYNVAVGAVAPYPSPMPPGFDVWILAATIDQVSGAGTLAAALSLEPLTDNLLGWGIDESGVAATGISTLPLAYWDSVVTVGREFGLLGGVGQPWAHIGLRLPRPPLSDVALDFDTTSSAIATFRCYILTGVFPIGLGQDVIL